MTLSYLGKRNAFNTPWTVERDALLARLWAEGYSASQIADQIMGITVTRCAVIGRIHRLKLPAREPRKRAIRPDTRRPRQSVPKPPAPPPRPGTPKMWRLKLVELKPHHCRWPIGEAPFLFCGADAASGEVYCPFHQRMARGKEKAK